MTTAAASDPFESTANSAHYVPRPATERVLEAVELALVQGAGPVALTGPSGLGKTMLLQVLADRLRTTYRIVSLPYPALSAGDLCRWVLDALGEPSSLVGEDPEGALLDHAFRGAASGQEILLLVDDASALPPKSARSLATLVKASGGAVRAVLAAGDDARLGAALAALGAGVREIRYEEPMDPEETAAYVRARVAGGGEAEGRAARFDADTLARVYGATGGIPRRVHELGSVLWRAEAGSDIPEAIESWLREDEGRADEPADEALEVEPVGTDLEMEPALDDSAEESAPMASLDEPPPAVRTPEVSPSAVRTPEVSEPGRRRARGTWVAVLLLALLAISVPYALPRLDTWLEERFPETGTAGEGASPVVTAPQELVNPPAGSTSVVASDPVGTDLDREASAPLGESAIAEGTKGVGLAADGLQVETTMEPPAVSPSLPPAVPSPVASEAGPDGKDRAAAGADEVGAALSQGSAPLPNSDRGNAAVRESTRAVERSDPPSPPMPGPDSTPSVGMNPAATAVKTVEESGADLRAVAPEAAATGLAARALRVGPGDPARSETDPSRTAATAPVPTRGAPDASPAAEGPVAADESVGGESGPPEPVALQETAPPSAAARPAKTPTSPGQDPAADPVPDGPGEAAAAETAAPPAPRPEPQPEPKPKPRPSEVLVTIDAPPGVVIHVDGGVVGVTPLKNLRLSPGLHVFRAEFADDRAVVRAVEISTRPAPVRFE